jgi:hydrogenase maturation protease
VFLVIGYGNLLRGDDGAGRLVAESLGKLPPGVLVESVHQLTPELAEAVSRASGVVFVDCAAEGTPGDVLSSSVPPPGRNPSAVTHLLTPGLLLEYARRLYGHRPAAALVTLVGQTFGFGQPLSEPVRAAIAPAREEVLRRISLWRSCGARLSSQDETPAFEPAGTKDP